MVWSPATSPVLLRGEGRDPGPALLQPSPSSVRVHRSRTVSVCNSGQRHRGGREAGRNKARKKKWDGEKHLSCKRAMWHLHSVCLDAPEADPETRSQVQVVSLQAACRVQASGTRKQPKPAQHVSASKFPAVGTGVGDSGAVRIRPHGVLPPRGASWSWRDSPS